MSKIGKVPVKIPEGTTVAMDGGVLLAKGKLGEQRVPISPLVDVKIEGGEITVSPKDTGGKAALVMWGTMRSLVANAVEGVSAGFVKELELKGVGYKVTLKGNVLDMSLGYSHNIEYRLPDGVKAEIPSPTEIKLISADKALLGKTASEIRALREPEPYKGKGVKYKDETIRRKEGKKK
ncbi:MAG: 50S ribosomal protein L6 [Rickettsiales bacterium]|jgi:large subunit ribosomal protein L6|nr:50S ribosomal protein L6 [Rickettsiales bacterium]